MAVCALMLWILCCSQVCHNASICSCFEKIATVSDSSGVCSTGQFGSPVYAKCSSTVQAGLVVPAGRPAVSRVNVLRFNAESLNACEKTGLQHSHRLLNTAILCTHVSRTCGLLATPDEMESLCQYPPAAFLRTDVRR